jgi:hypothetical protein
MPICDKGRKYRHSLIENRNTRNRFKKTYRLITEENEPSLKTVHDLIENLADQVEIA